MEFTRIHENKLKVILTAGDMRDLELDYNRMDYADPETRRSLLAVLEKGRVRARFNPRGAKLFIEVYPCEGGGCVLYFTCLHTDPSGRAGLCPVLFEFDSPDDLTVASRRVYTQYGHRIHRSSLYRLHGRYRLVVYPLDYSDRRSVYFLGEYGRLIGEGEVLAAFTDEHGQELIRDSAIDLLAEYFSD